jgi:hypothetical protein
VLLESKASYQSVFINWDKVKHGVPLGSILGPFLFLVCIKSLPKIIKIYSKPVIFADDTSLIIMNPIPTDLKEKISCCICSTKRMF